MIVGRLIAWLCLALAVFSLGWDVASWVDAGGFQLSSLGEQWSRLHPQSLAGFQTAVEGAVAWLWDPVLVTVLGWPGWLTFGALGLLLRRLFRNRRQDRWFIK